MTKDTIIPVKFNKKLTFSQIEMFSNMCDKFAKDNDMAVAYISHTAVVRRVEERKNKK